MEKVTFLRRREKAWRRLEELVNELERSRGRAPAGVLLEFSARMREAAHDLSLLRSHDWGDGIEERLNLLLLRAHNLLYRTRGRARLGIARFIFEEFPRELRAHAAYFWLSAALFVLPGVLTGVLAGRDPEFAAQVVPRPFLDSIEDMYSRDPREKERVIAPEGMTGFYVRNNVSIALRCYAFGILFGLGTAYILVFNSLFLGTVTGYVVGRGYGANFFEFVLAHGAFELTAIVVAGAAGFILGWTVIAPGSLSRVDALKVRGTESLKLILGAAAMLGIAALIEAFWSPQPLPRPLKFAASGLAWMLVVTWLLLGGRTGEGAGKRAKRRASPLGGPAHPAFEESLESEAVGA